MCPVRCVLCAKADILRASPKQVFFVFFRVLFGTLLVFLPRELTFKVCAISFARCMLLSNLTSDVALVRFNDSDIVKLGNASSVNSCEGEKETRSGGRINTLFALFSDSFHTIDSFSVSRSPSQYPSLPGQAREFLPCWEGDTHGD